MSRAHPATSALELYVIGAHDQLAVADVEAHLRVCDSCTEEVRRQVQVDMALGEIAADAGFCPGCGALLAGGSCAHCGAVAEVGGFRIEKVLVQNAHGRMYLARDPAGQAVALKELAFVQPPRAEAVAPFEREARLLRQLSHPQIPRFLASFRTGEGVGTRLYLAQEYVEGESLQVRLGRHQFSEPEATAIALQVLSILEYLQGLAPMVFHRDIKPANLIQRPDGRIALVDFGAARDLGPTVGATLVGTFGYMPLEQMGGIVDATTDGYALGATLGHLLSRREPWTFLEDPAALERLNVSPGFRAYLGKLLARRPADRFASAAAAALALRSPPPRARRRLALPRPPLGVVAVLLSSFALALGAGLFSLTRHGRLRERQLPPAASEPLERERTEIVVEERVLPPKAGMAQLAIDPAEEPYRLSLPTSVLAPGERVSAQVRICVATDGRVATVDVMRSGNPKLDASLVATLGKWRYRPYLVDGRAVPFCTQLRYELQK